MPRHGSPAPRDTPARLFAASLGASGALLALVSSPGIAVAQRDAPSAPANAIRGDKYARYCTPAPKIALKRVLIRMKCTRAVVFTASYDYVWSTPTGTSVTSYGGSGLEPAVRGQNTIVDDSPAQSTYLCQRGPVGATAVSIRVRLRRNPKSAGYGGDPSALTYKVLKTKTSKPLKLSC